MVARYAVNNLNQYKQVGEFLPTHDRNGNLASMGMRLHRYDAMNRLMQMTDGGPSCDSSMMSGTAVLPAPFSLLTLNIRQEIQTDS